MSTTKKFNKSSSFLNNSNTFGPIITTNGNIGINTTSPNTQLHVVYNNSAGIRLEGSTGNVNISIKNTSLNGRDYLIGVGASSSNSGQGNFYIYDNALSATRLAINSSGNIGISTTNPAYTLDINGQINASTRINTSWISAHQFVNTGNNNPGVLSALAPSVTIGNNVSIYVGQTIANGNTAQLSFFYQGNNNTANNIKLGFYGGSGSSLTLLNNGNIGINNTSPAYTLDVNGTINANAFSSSFKDTLFQYALRYESANIELGGIAIDTGDNIYIHGLYQTQGTFYATNGSSVVVTGTGTAGTAFVSKYDSTGAFQYNLRIDGDAYDRLKKITTDSLQNLYVCGYGASGSNTTKFYATNGSTIVATMGNLGNHISWIGKYDNTGTLQYTSKIDGTNSDYISSITFDSFSNSIYVCGATLSTQCNFYATNGTTILSTIASFSSITQTGLIAKYDNTGAFKYAIRLGTVGSSTFISSVATDPAGYLYVAGYSTGIVGVYDTNGSTLVATMGNSGNTDAFVFQFNSNGSYVNNPTRVSGTNNEYMNVITTDSNGYMYVGGYTTSTQANVYDITGIANSFGNSNTSNCGFVLAYNSGGYLQSLTTINGTGNEEVNDITIDKSGYLYASGRSTSSVTQFINSGTVVQTIGNTYGANWLYNINNNQTLYVDCSSSYGQYVRFDSNNNIYVHGQLNSGVGNIMDSSNKNIVSQIDAILPTNSTGYLIKYNTNNPIIQNLCTSSIGIGTTSPTSSLDVRGRIITNNIITTTSYCYYDTGTPTLYTSLGATTGTINGYMYFKFNSGNYNNRTWTPTSFYNNVGIYTPITGIYYVHVTVYGTNTNGAEVFISKNAVNNNDLNTTLITTTSWPSSSPQSNCSCTVYLTTSDYIAVGYYNGSGTSTIGNRCSMSMTLIQQTS